MKPQRDRLWRLAVARTRRHGTATYKVRRADRRPLRRAFLRRKAVK